ncbi:MAG: LamG-like jellyroll fold domain-containing protein [Verrucomicrobiota bacterium]
MTQRNNPAWALKIQERNRRRRAKASPSASLLQNLISHWRLDELSGDRYDAHGTNHLADTTSVPSVLGKLGNAADFDGDTNYLTCASNASLQAGDFDCCFAAWVYLRSDISLEQNHHFIGKWDAAEFDLAFKASATGCFALDYGSGSVDAVTFGAPDLDNWFFVVAWHDSVGDELGIQINNGAVDVVSYGDGASPSEGAFCLGTLIEAAGRADVYLDSVSYWKRTLSAGERSRLWNNGAGLDYANFA